MDFVAEQRVRFEEQCVLIPDPAPSSRMPRLVTKSYSLPLWRRKGQEALSPTDPDTDAKPESREDEHVVLRVSVPSITRKAQSPTRTLSLHQPLTPCLIHSPHPHPHPHPHAPSPDSCASPSLPGPRTPRARRPSQSSPPTSPSPTLSAASPRALRTTVPLRACCPDCFRALERCAQAGERWEERFSRGARRRRSASVDAGAQHAAHAARHRPVRDAMPGFDKIVAVDEVERVRRARGADVDGEEDGAMEAGTEVEVEVEVEAETETETETKQSAPALLPSISRRARYDALEFPVTEPDEDLHLPGLSASLSSVPSLAPGSPPFCASLTAELERALSIDESPAPDSSRFAPGLCLSTLSHTSVSCSSSSAAPIPIPMARAPIEPLLGQDECTSPELPPLTPTTSPEDGRAGRDQQRRRRPLNLLGPASFLRASTEMLRGVNFMGSSSGMPLSV
ncbi:hypothetical protein CERSUDRAFT_90043 [Gelatoporia subvermispora B]|uniref:Uncharacterized protein n=1 Tax=Ceriporiopsis subvermispora (strain B) TaxID=914234 RepID=M2RRH5_CERS8|nr:hypothetical protein CERSUDRAFT_90043 [Gelatoporia subvermispora B]